MVKARTHPLISTTELSLPKGSCSSCEMCDADCEASRMPVPGAPVLRTSAVTMMAMARPRPAANAERTRLSTRN